MLLELMQLVPDAKEARDRAPGDRRRRDVNVDVDDCEGGLLHFRKDNFLAVDAGPRHDFISCGGHDVASGAGDKSFSHDDISR